MEHFSLNIRLTDNFNSSFGQVHSFAMVLRGFLISTLLK